jgi:large subunit ribosomal protein L4e
MRKNKRQAYGVKCHFGPTGIVAGHQHSAHSWGTGRAVSRIPRVSGGGTHRAGQGAFGNMCRGGRMFAPTKIFRRWHRKMNTAQKRQAVASCLAASASAPLVEARGHRISDRVKEIPLVVDGIESIVHTKEAISCLVNLGLNDELEKSRCKHSRPTKGKMRGRRHKQRKGPLIVFKNDLGIVKSFRNIPGVDICRVDSLNLLQLAPGGHVGRLIIWSKTSFEIMENWLEGKKAPQMLMTNSDLHALINSDEIQGVIRAPKNLKKTKRKRNLLRNRKVKYETFRGFSLEEVQQKRMQNQ